MTAEWRSPPRKVRGSARTPPKAPSCSATRRPDQDAGGALPRTPAIGCSLSAAFPDPFPGAPPTTPGARLGSREGSGRRREERGEVPARAPLAARARAARSRRPRRHLFSPSVCLSAVGFVCPPRRPSPPRRHSGPQPPSTHQGRDPGSPGPASPSCGRGPLSRGLSVRRRSPGTRSAEAAGKAPPRQEPAARLAPVGSRRRPPAFCLLAPGEGRAGCFGGWVRASRAGV